MRKLKIIRLHFALIRIYTSVTIYPEMARKEEPLEEREEAVVEVLGMILMLIK